MLEVVTAPVGRAPEATAVFTIEPAFMSARVTTYAPVHVVEASGASLVTGHLITEGTPDRLEAVSLISIPLNVTLPVLTTR